LERGLVRSASSCKWPWESYTNRRMDVGPLASGAAGLTFPLALRYTGVMMASKAPAVTVGSEAYLSNMGCIRREVTANACSVALASWGKRVLEGRKQPETVECEINNLRTSVSLL
jgi:hypothetical protein